MTAAELADLQGVRNQVDDQLADPDVSSRAYAMLIVERADRIVSAIANCCPADVRDSIRAAVVEYEQKIRPQL